VTSQVDDSTFDSGQGLIDAERYEEAIRHFESIAAAHPDDPKVLYHLAGAYDAAGNEEQAVAPYRAALASGGLTEDEAIRCRIQLASTLRNLDLLDEAVAILAALCAEHPEYRAGRAFLALALTSAGKATMAVVELLDLLLTHPGPVEDYNRSLRWYVEDLRGSAT
jgi:thioredoxin-like negative regulator of GroEL